MKVEYNYLPQEFKKTNVLFNEWKKLIKSTEFTLGPFVKDFEEKFKNYMGAKHCISTNNGTDALILALKSLGIGSGDEVITVSNTFYATVGAIVAVGATPVLVDSDDRFQIDIRSIENNISKKTKAIIPVHWGGASPEINKIVEICKNNKLFLVEDACMGIGAQIEGKSAGTFGDVNAFSMHPLKSLNVMGDGGMVLTDNDNIASWMSKYRNHGMVDRDHIDFWGINMRIQPLQAIVGMQGLDRLEKTLKVRRRNAAILDQGFQKLIEKGLVKIPERKQNYKETFALYMGLFKDRDKLKKFMEDREIEVKIHYPIPLHKQKAAKNNCIFNLKTLSNSEYQAKHLLTIPVHQFLSEKQMRHVVKVIEKFYE